MLSFKSDSLNLSAFDFSLVVTEIIVFLSESQVILSIKDVQYTVYKKPAQISATTILRQAVSQE